MSGFAWTEFYTEFATSLLSYADDRASLIEKVKQIYINAKMKLPTLEKGNNIVDIDPFTIFGLFNKGITNDNRIAILSQIKELFDISADVPTNFDGIPVLNNMSATFYYFSGERGENDIDNLWNLFKAAISYADKQDNEADFTKAFDLVVSQKGVSWNITMGLYWIRPLTYINLDARNRKLLENNQSRFKPDVDVIKMLKRMLSAENYLLIMDKVKEVMTEYESFPDLSFDAWKTSTEDSEAFFGEDSSYWPTLAEYDPKLSKEDWKKYLLEVEIPNHPSPLKMLKGIIELGGEASCKQLANKYGGHPSVYVGCTASMGRRVKKYFNLPPCMDGDQERYFPFMFFGKGIDDKDGHSYIYKIRPTLLTALEELDLSNLNPNYEEGDDMPQTITNLEEIIASLKEIGGQGSLEEICAQIEKRGILPALKNAKDYKASVRAEIYRHSSDCDAYVEGNEDIFVSIEGKGSGIWGLRNMISRKHPLNTILYGPPGTGKTYNTVVYAVAIIENKLLADVKSESYSDVLERYNAYRAEGLIEFTTFHQSYGYEEFIEGIKPFVIESNGNKDVCYDIAPGIFKRFCEFKIAQTSNSVSFDAAWNNLLSEVKLSNNEVEIKRDRLTKVLRWDENNQKFYDTTKGLSYLYADRQSVESFYHGKLDRGENSGSKAHIYHNSKGICELLRDKYHLDEKKTVVRNKVFVIDEINRGNISKIFGELITLIEPSKRIGQPEGMRAKLPYSQQLFGVPDNVYIIGTMNTADRSIATIDTALRRRFRFKEMMPDADVLKGISIDDISVSEMLARMNKRISVLYDREHTIGHAYFIPLRDKPTIEQLAEIFENAIVPLLQEYFYEDYEKIRLVLGDNNKDNKEDQFIVAVENDYNELFGSADIGFDDSVTYEINRTAFDNIEAYRSI